MLGSFLLNHNSYSDELAMVWENEIYRNNIKTFNMLSEYNIQEDRGTFTPNQTLLD